MLTSRNVTAKSAGPAGTFTFESRLIRFDSAADMPADITSNANVLADLVSITGVSSTAERCQVLWHGGACTWNAAAGAGPIATGALIAVNSLDNTAAAATLTYTDLAGGGSSSSGVAGRMMVGPNNPMIDMSFTAGALTRLDLIGIPVGVTPTSIVPSFVEVRFYSPA